jgi:hypothetical protein
MRRSGGGRTPTEKEPDIVEVLLCLLEHNTAGDPMTGLRWSRRTSNDRIPGSERTRHLRLAQHRCLPPPSNGLFSPCQPQAAFYQRHPDRNRQFEYLAYLRDRFQQRHLPIVSLDSKKGELVGNFRNPGHRWECTRRRVYDYDFHSDSIGVAIPYGIYDVHETGGALVVGVSRDTPAFAAHAIAHWWHQEGSQRDSGSRQPLILTDTGGSNSCRCYAWKT